MKQMTEHEPSNNTEELLESLTAALANESPENIKLMVFGLVRRLAVMERFIGPNSFESLRNEARLLVPHLPQQ